MHRVGRRFQLPLHRLGPLGLARVRPIKWLLLLGLVLLLHLLTGLGVTPHSLGNPYCDICPSRVVSSLLTGNTEQLAIALSDGWSFALGGLVQRFTDDARDLFQARRDILFVALTEVFEVAAEVEDLHHPPGVLGLRRIVA